MKIIQVNKFFDLRGGAEMYMHRLSAHLAERGHEVHVFSTYSDHNKPSSDEKYFITRYELNQKEDWITDLKKARNFFWNSEAKKNFERMLDEVQPDVVHIHNAYHHLSSSIFFALQKRPHIKVVQTLHDYKLACPNYKMYVNNDICEKCRGGKYYQAVKNRCLAPGILPNCLASLEMSFTKITHIYEKTVDFFICPSKFMKKKMEEWGEPPSKMIYLPNPIDIPAEVSPQRGGGNYIYIGRLHEVKGVDIIIKAITSVDNLKLDIVGEGPEREKLEELARRTDPDRVKFFGFQTGEKLKELRSKAKAMLLPSRWYENAPLSILESLSWGIPVIGSDIGGIPEMIEDGKTGFLAKNNNVDDWISSLLKMEKLNLEDRLKMGDLGREFVARQMNWKKHLQKIEEIYQS